MLPADVTCICLPATAHACLADLQSPGPVNSHDTVTVAEITCACCFDVTAQMYIMAVKFF